MLGDSGLHSLYLWMSCQAARYCSSERERACLNSPHRIHSSRDRNAGNPLKSLMVARSMKSCYSLVTLYQFDTAGIVSYKGLWNLITFGCAVRAVPKCHRSWKTPGVCWFIALPLTFSLWGFSAKLFQVTMVDDKGYAPLAKGYTWLPISSFHISSNAVAVVGVVQCWVIYSNIYNITSTTSWSAPRRMTQSQSSAAIMATLFRRN